MRSALLALLLAAPAFAAKADKATVELVERFLKTPTADLPAGRIDEFVAVDPETLPRKLRVPFKAKRLELYTMRQLAEGKKKGTVRTPERECDLPIDAKSREVLVLEASGYSEVQEDEVSCVSSRTKCSEREMMCEFTLQIVVEKTKRGTRRRFFLNPKDPLMAIVAACRGGAGGQTNFFGIGAPLCSH